MNAQCCTVRVLGQFPDKEVLNYLDFVYGIISLTEIWIPDMIRYIHIGMDT